MQALEKIIGRFIPSAAGTGRNPRSEPAVSSQDD
jgi:hypothetical protein